MMMKKVITYLGLTLFLIAVTKCTNEKAENVTADYIISKKNGRIILAYKAFEDFLQTDRSWENYMRMVLDAYPEIRYVHARQLEWGTIDSIKFPAELKNYKREDLEHYFTQYDEHFLNELYDSIIEKAHRVLPPLKSTPVDLCFFFPYSGCFINPAGDRSTIYISLYIDPNDVKKIMIHEYAHSLHLQRCPREPLTLKREVVSEGMAVYLTTVIDPSFELRNAIPFMPESSVNWCREHEQTIKDSIHVELADSGQQIFLRYISDGNIATPPKGFVQKTAYYVGYRIIEACLARGIKLEDICSMDSRAVIDSSEYFTRLK
jgi:uncharacterized protein YjaZ